MPHLSLLFLFLPLFTFPQRAFALTNHADITLAPRNAANSVATITLAPKSEYMETVSNPPSITGTNVVVIPRAQQTDGLDFYIPQQLAQSVNKTISENCGLSDQGNCESSIASVIKPGSQDLQARAPLGPLVLIVPALAGLVTAALIQGYFVSGGGEIRGHVPGSDLDQMSAAQPVATLVYATAADAATRITVTSTIATAPSLSEPPQPTMTNGNVPLRMNSDLGLAFEEFVTRATQGTRECKDIPSDPSVSCIEDIANLVFPQFAPGGLFNSLLKLAILMPQKDIKPIVPYVQATRTSAAVSNLGLNSGSLVSVVKLVCWLLYDWLSDSHPSPSIWDIPASALVNETSTATTPTSSALPCPTGMFTLDYEYCNGNPVTKKCGGLKNGQWKGCPYNPPPLPAYAPYASKLALQQALQKLWSYAPDQYNPDASISTNDQPGLGIYRVQFKQQVSPVDNFTVTVFNDRDQSTNQIGTYIIDTPVTAIALTPGTLILTIVGDPTLQTSKLTFSLTDAAGTLHQADESSTQADSPNAYCDSSNTYVGVTRLVNCYFLTKPAMTQGKYRLHLLQQWKTWCPTVQRCSKTQNWSQVVKSIYDPQGNLIGGPTPNQEVSGGPLLENKVVSVYVKDPLRMDSYMQFSFPATGLKFYSTSTTNDPDDPAWCQQVAMTPWSMGYNAQGGQREFDCYFDPS